MGKKRKLAPAGRPNKLAKRAHANGTTNSTTSGSARKPAPPGTKPQQKQKQKQTAAPKQQQQQQHVEPTIPFSAEDKILLVGDGDLSFAASLVEHHYCADVTATVFEKDMDELLEKYPHAAENIAKIEAEDGCRVVFGVDATKMAPFASKPTRSSSKASASAPTTDDAGTGTGASSSGSGGVGIMDRIIFNFPHVGGKSTDVNRQVRYNQELLVAFFARAIPSLAPTGGAIVVTLFEGEPYTLWNVRDLARHSGLRVERSFRFQASAYPGYRHARTLGAIRDRKTGEVVVDGGAWRAEDREARSYVFVKKDGDGQGTSASTSSVAVGSAGQRGTKRSRKRGDDSSDDEE
ncbi:hypothetical protein F4777DRAFT_424550 [Nemania sp. FL0916]|nr:hypothetical protein F4777DRAFT_424550 [Nemania sp. FL0916]